MVGKSAFLSSFLFIGAGLVFSGCSGDENKGSNPQPTTVMMSGTVTFPSAATVDLTEVTVGLGDYDEAVNTGGDFTIRGNEHVPGLAVARNNGGMPVLMGIVPDPTEGQAVELDVHSTALALAFLSPFVCIADAEYAEEVLDDLESLPELTVLEDLLAQELSTVSLAVSYDDEEIDSALSRLVLAYVNSYPAALERYMPHLPKRSPEVPSVGQDGEVQIDPSWQVSGHTLSWKGGSSFEISNAYGRWAYCCTPNDSFFLYPNGDFLDIIKGSRPWSPSKRTFTMSVSQNADTQFVRVFGYGWGPFDNNVWDSLNSTEQRYAHWGGMSTVCLELCCHTLAVVTNTSKVYGNGQMASRIGETLFGFMLSDGVFMQQAVGYIHTNDPWGLAWHLTKQMLNELTTSPSYRQAFATVTGITLTDGALSKLLSWLWGPAKAVVVFNSVTSVLKTVMGLSTARFRTSFAVWRDVEEWGSVRGQVAEKDYGKPIEGATVTLTGDENNPLNPDHQKTTGSDGYYRFDYIGIGEKSITAAKSGYASRTVTVTIETDKTVTAHITLQKQSGGLSGRVLNGIFVHHGREPAYFEDAVDLTARPVGSDEDTRSSYIYDGTYNIALPSGTWWIIAEHEDYHPDSIQVIIPVDGAVSASRDLVLEPDPTMSGRIYFDMDNNGRSEQDIYITFPEVGLSRPTLQSCSQGGSGSLTMEALGGRGSSLSNFDFVLFGFNTALITGADVYAVGGIEWYGCTATPIYSIAWCGTSRYHCVDEDQQSYPMTFTIMGDPESAACDCGIGQPGNFYLTDWGTELGDIVAGGITADLAGWKNCSCSSGDTDGDGVDDDWDVGCANVQLDINFRLLVGSDYLVGWVPGQVGPRQVLLGSGF